MYLGKRLCTFDFSVSLCILYHTGWLDSDLQEFFIFRLLESKIDFLKKITYLWLHAYYISLKLAKILDF